MIKFRTLKNSYMKLKENYLNQENFILREKSNKYLVIQSKISIF